MSVTFVPPPPLARPPVRSGYGSDLIKCEIKVRHEQQHVLSYTGYSRSFDIVTKTRALCLLEKQKRHSLDDPVVEILPIYAQEACIEVKNIRTDKVRRVRL